jgi:class 3 adenylate cyclase
MAFKDELEAAVKNIFADGWAKREGTVVPEPQDLKLGNDGIRLDATILYADMADSTKLVDNQSVELAAEVYKSYMACAARIIKLDGGSITAYDGDRVMGTFIGDVKNTTATRTALKISWAVKRIINPALISQYGPSTYQMQHCIGIDTSSIMASRIGVRNDNDLVWVGRAANYGAKLSSVDAGYVYITETVFNKLADVAKFNGEQKTPMWEQRCWTAMNNMIVYRSGWIWAL